MTDLLWSLVSPCFTTDDGSLPGIEVSNLTSQEVAAIYAMLRRRSRLIGDPPEFWSRADDASRLIDSVPNAAALVASGEAEPFHLLLTEISVDQAKLPDIGLFVWPDCIELDYRMGTAWEQAEVAGFFELLSDCGDLASGALIRPDKGDGPPHSERFQQAWAWHVANDPVITLTRTINPAPIASRSPRLVHPEQAGDFVKQVTEEETNTA